MRRRRAVAPALLPRQAALASAGRGRPAREPAAAAIARPAEPRLGFRPGGGSARPGAAGPRGHRPLPAALLQAGEGHEFPRHGGDAAPRQFGLHARPADHRGGDLCRHPGADAGALRREGGDPGLHHPGLEGRPEPRGVACRRQATESRAPERPAPHRLQAGRRALAARAQEPRADDARGAAQGEHRRRGARLGAQAPARAAGAAQDPDGDLRRRAGGRPRPCR